MNNHQSLSLLPKVERIHISKDLSSFQGQDIEEHASSIAEKIDDEKAFTFQVLATFIKTPIIEDSFDSDSDRNKFEEELKAKDRKAYKLLQKNRLRGAYIQKASLILEDYAPMHGFDNSSWKEQLDEIMGRIRGQKYINLTKQEKIDVVNELSLLAYKAYSDMYRQIQ